MTAPTIRKIALAVGAAIAMGISAQAVAAPQFTINPKALNPANPGPFIATGIAGSSSELLTLTATGATGTGILFFSGFTLNGFPVSPLVSGDLINYNIYVTFQLVNTLVSGTSGAAGSTYVSNALNFQFFADPGANTVPHEATAGPGNATTNASVTGTADDILLAFGSLVSGTAGFDSLGGAFLNSIQTLDVCTGAGTATQGGVAVSASQTGILGAPNVSCTSGTGNGFFAAPVPFYDLAFTQFNNTTQGVTRTADGTHIAITQATGSVDFNRIPEPSTLALFGIAALGLGLSSRRRKS